jgi:hypothetical protein
MIWKRILPPEGGGAIRRLIRIRKEMFEFSFQKQSSNSFDKPTLPMKPLTIIDFSEKDDAADARAVSIGNAKQGWRISDDEVIGGFSRATFQLLQPGDDKGDAPQDATINNNHEEDRQNEDQYKDQQLSNQQQQQQPFVRWSGTIDTRIGPKSRAKRSGFCAIRCPEFPFGGIPVGNKYNALEVLCRTDGRAYTLNLKVQTYFPDDLYQSLITVKKEEVEELMELRRKQLKNDPRLGGNNSSSNSTASTAYATTTDSTDETSAALGFISVVLPFNDFILTSHGMIKAQQRSLDGGVQLQHMGLTLMDEQDGPFTFDLAKIRLVNYDKEEGKIMNDVGAGDGDVDGDGEIDGSSSGNKVEEVVEMGIGLEGVRDGNGDIIEEDTRTRTSGRNHDKES